jgi:hypothetical protein
MARFIQAEFPTEHAGITRVTNGVTALRGFSITRSALAALAVVGKPVTAVTTRLGAAFAAWQAARKQRNEDYKLWNVALQDARIMADLSRAMSRDAARDVRGYY